jgi:phospholipid/cholesterol/gamma-HCH transport system substrate-binding protein
MDERVVQFRVGVMVLATLIITGILVILFGEMPNPFKQKYTIQIRFAEAPNVVPDTPIRKSGVLIGRVTDVKLMDEGGVLVSAKIDGDKVIRQNEAARITSTLLGDAGIQIIEARRVDLPKLPVQDGAELPGLTYDDPIQVISNLQDKLAGAIGSVTQTSNELGQVIHRVDGLLQTNEQKINGIITQAHETAGMLQQTVRNANDVFGNPETKAKLQDTLEQVPQLMRDTRETIRQMNNTIALVDKNLQNLDRFTGTLGDQGEAVIGQLGSSAAKLDTLLGEMVKFSQALNSGKGTLGKLMNDDELYDNINKTAGQLEALSRQMRPIMNDVRVLSDDLARHPEKIGLSGALRRSTGTK